MKSTSNFPLKAKRNVAQRLIDTHIHIWNFDKAEYSWLKGDSSILNRSYGLEELEPEREAAGVTEGILVQAANNFEDTDWMLEVAQSKDWIKGVVGWLPLLQPDETAKIWEQKYRSNNYFKGVRHLIHDEPDARWLLKTPVLQSLQWLAAHKIPYDVVGVLPAHLQTVLEVADRVPGLVMVLDHLNQPPIATGEKFGNWGMLMKEASTHPNFYTKISGLGTTAKKDDWSSADIEPYIGFVLEHFGPHRCLCGGDWPVSLLAGSYAKTWDKYRQVLTAHLSAADQEKVFYKTAESVYRL